MHALLMISLLVVALAFAVPVLALFVAFDIAIFVGLVVMELRRCFSFLN